MSNIMPTVRGLNFWSLKQRIKDNTIQRTNTFQLKQRIAIFTLSPKTALLDQKMAILLNNFKPQTNNNLRFIRYNGCEMAQQYLAMHGKKRTTGDRPSHSFVIAFLQFIEAVTAHPSGVNCDPIPIKDTSGTTNNVSGSTPYNGSFYNMMGWEAPASDDTYGIVVGTGTNAPTNADYSMQTKIANGTSTCQLQYQACSVGRGLVVGANVDLVMSRLFINTSGSTITLKEIGIYDKINPASGADQFYMMVHDAVNQAINNQEVGIVSYDFRTTV
jgi:hypothetical protein